MRQAIIVVALAGALASCSDESSGPTAPPPPGCDTGAILGTAGSTCYSDPAMTSPASCTGTWVASGCPGGADLVGMCIETSGRITYYYSTDFSSFATHDAGVRCGLGHFVPMGSRVTASCDLRANIMFSSCIDMSGTVSDVDPEGSSFGCSFFGGTWSSASACTATGRTGTCSYVSGGVQIRQRFYGATTATEAGCTGPGDTWTPG